MSAAYSIFEAEFRSFLRRNTQALSKRLFGTIIIALLGLLFSFACIRLVKFVIDNPELFPEGSNEGYGTILLIFFALFTLRSAGITYRRIIKSKRMELHLVQPISPRQIMFGMFLSILIPNMLLASLLFLVFYTGNIVTNSNIDLSNEFLGLFFLFTILSALSGYMFSIVGALYPFSRKMTFLLTLSPILVVLMLVANGSHSYPNEALAITSICLLLLLIYFYNMDRIFIEALESYKIHSSSHKNPIRILQFKWLGSLLGTRVSSICSKEVISSIREKDVLSSAFSTFSIAFILVFWWFKMGIPSEPIGDLPSSLYYPGMLAISMYMGALLQCTMLGSTILGVEGKRMWIMKSNPVESILIMKGKASALIMMALPGLIAIWLPICILAGFPLKVTLFFGECVLILLFCNTGLGIWAGSAFANFEESDRGNPDILVQFMLMGTSAFISSIILILPATVMLWNHDLGLFAGLIFSFVSFGILFAGIRAASSSYKSIFIDSYGV
ncbi:MAG: hypothetical protein BET99_02990 [Marine Group III euryarchaeote CG-Epi2]|uniref:Uncharacterized protein n=1 Tax=Marine Group III euryarchaeote CG-Epi2 TaxID=1888996 RepID=A0A1J5TS72_9ARCH|nr:MAG: hypothetical protein BET99_02990 [Marine Group III euryarchaeote CG-Epi2]